MLNKFDDKTLEATARLFIDKNFLVFLAYLESEGKRIAKLNKAVLEETAVRWNQGCLQCLDDLLDKSKASRVDLEKVQALNKKRLTRGISVGE